MKAAVKKVETDLLDQAVDSCHRVRLALETCMVQKGELAERLRTAKAGVAKAETALAVAQGQAKAFELAGKPVSADLVTNAEAQLSAAQAELREAASAHEAIPAAIALLNADLDNEHARLSAAVAEGTAGLRAKAEALHRDGLQNIRDAFTIIAALDSRNIAHGVEIPDLRGGYDAAWQATQPSAEISAEIGRFAPAIHERNAALRRLL